MQLPPPGIPPAEVEITEELVSALLAAQHPDLMSHGLALFGSGWDNTTYRLGAELAVRLPRRQLGADMMVKEQRWLPQLAPQLPLPIGRPVRLGGPGNGYPWPWNVVEWIDGVSAIEAPIPESDAAVLGSFLASLHQPSPPEAPRNKWRGGALADRAPSVEGRLERLEAHDLSVPVGRIAETWHRASSVPIDTPATWLHGDVHPRNLTVDGGRLAAVIDWGDLCSGDPATDLAAAWLLFPTDAHTALHTAYGDITEATWERARGWAIFFGVVMVDAGRRDDHAWAAAGNEALTRACT
jgi:aminoglycoside phosphotransferase (APT) family kinase protein